MEDFYKKIIYVNPINSTELLEKSFISKEEEEEWTAAYKALHSFDPVISGVGYPAEEITE